MELEKFGDVVQDGKEDDRENVGPSRQEWENCKRMWFWQFYNFYNLFSPKMYKLIDL